MKNVAVRDNLCTFQALIDLICDVKQMEAAVKEMKYDARKAPLGKQSQN